MPAVATLPEPILRSYIARLERDVAVVERWNGSAAGAQLRKVVADLTGMLDNPTYRWVTPEVAAGIMRCSAETIRRQCRKQTAEFEFEQDVDSGHYRIWLASVPSPEGAQAEPVTDTLTVGDE